MGKFRNGYLAFNTGVEINKILDEDNMISNDNEALATQQSIKAYVDNMSTGETSIHGLDSTAHIGITGTENNFMSINADGLPQDSGYDATSFVLAGLEDTITFNASRNSSNTSNIYLRTGDGTPTNISRFILPWNCTLIAISTSTNSSETWVAEVHSGLSLVSGASLSSVATTSNYSTYNIDFNAGDDISLYCNGTGIDNPRIMVVFRRR